jgi:hypothetical protein
MLSYSVLDLIGSRCSCCRDADRRPDAEKQSIKGIGSIVGVQEREPNTWDNPELKAQVTAAKSWRVVGMLASRLSSEHAASKCKPLRWI